MVLVAVQGAKCVYIHVVRLFNLILSFALCPTSAISCLPDYNTPVATPAPQKPTTPAHSHHHHAIYAAEATGLLLMAILVLVLIVIRYWPNIQWSAR